MKELPPPGGVVALERREADHLFKVLRAAPGERFRLLDGRGKSAIATVEPGKLLQVESLEEHPCPELKFHLFFAQPRRNILDELLPACAEVGVWKLHPLICTRSVAKGTPNERWQLQLTEGCKQSGNPFLPEIAEPAQLIPALKQAKEDGITLFYGSIAGVEAGALPEGISEVGWIVGPEGGFTPEEESAMKELDVLPFNLGPWVMRLETAAICGIAVLRRVLALLLFAVVIFAGAGCGRSDVQKHPLVRKGDYYRDNGDFQLALKFYRRAADRFPERGELHLRLASLCDESLGDPLGAAWHYREFLRLSPDSVERESVEKCLKAVLDSFSSPKADPEQTRRISELEKENLRLRRGLDDTRRRMFIMQRQLNPPQRFYVVRRGDTPAVVARQNNVDLDAMLRTNKLNRRSRLYPGQKLIIPGS